MLFLGPTGCSWPYLTGWFSIDLLSCLPISYGALLVQVLQGAAAVAAGCRLLLPAETMPTVGHAPDERLETRVLWGWALWPSLAARPAQG